MNKWLLFLVLILVLNSSGCFVSTRKYQMIEQKLRDVTAQNASLETELKKVTKEKKSLESIRTELEKKIAELEEENKKLKKKK